MRSDSAVDCEREQVRGRKARRKVFHETAEEARARACGVGRGRGKRHGCEISRVPGAAGRLFEILAKTPPVHVPFRSAPLRSRARDYKFTERLRPPSRPLLPLAPADPTFGFDNSASLPLDTSLERPLRCSSSSRHSCRCSHYPAPTTRRLRAPTRRCPRRVRSTRSGVLSTPFLSDLPRFGPRQSVNKY